MQGFRFRLQRVLQWQVKVCHLEEEATRLCRLTVTEAEDRIARLRSESLVAEQELLSRHVIAASDLIALAEYRAQVVRRGHELEAQWQSVVAALEEQMFRLTAARLQLQRIETLRDRSHLDHKLAVNRELEELAMESHLSRRVLSAR